MNINCCCFHGLELERGLRFAFKSVSFEIMEMMEIRIRNTNLKNRDFFKGQRWSVQDSQSTVRNFREATQIKAFFCSTQTDSFLHGC